MENVRFLSFQEKAKENASCRRVAPPWLIHYQRWWTFLYENLDGAACFFRAAVGPLTCAHL